MQDTTTGSCLCGAVKYEVEGAAKGVTNCHCPMCRKQHGAPFATYGGYPNDRFRLTAGAEKLRSYRSGEKTARQFCETCGSSLFFVESDHPNETWVALGTLDGDPGAPIEKHIFVGQKAPWFTITDDIRQYETWPRREE